MLHFKGIGVLKAQKNQKENDLKKELEKQQLQVISEMSKDLKKKDMIIENMFLSIHKLTQEIEKLKRGE